MRSKRKSNTLKEVSELDDSSTVVSSIKPRARKRVAAKKDTESDTELVTATDDESEDATMAATAAHSRKLQPSKMQALMLTPTLPTSTRATNFATIDDELNPTRRLAFNAVAAATPGRQAQLNRQVKALEPMLVFCRVRPLSDDERKMLRMQSSLDASVDCVQAKDEKTLHCVAPTGTRNRGATQEFNFTRVFGPETDQETLFNQTASASIEEAVTKGQNYLLFAYGVTNSGKTYSVVGGEGAQRGITLRAIERLFDAKNSLMSTSSPSLLQESLIGSSDIGSLSAAIPARPMGVLQVRISYLEIYNEKCYDLLYSEPRGGLHECHLKADTEHDSVFVQGLREMIVHNVEEAASLIRAGAKQRTISKTALNDTSSRSHSVVIVRLMDVVQSSSTDRPIEQLWSKISVVDLAGSERATRNGAENNGEAQREANSINQSLSVLGRCMTTLRENSKIRAGRAHKPPPFRESALTFLFKDSLCGIGRTAMLCAVSMLPADFDENMLALKFSADASKIQFQTATNSHLDTEQLKTQLAKKKKEQSQLDAASSSSSSSSLQASPTRRAGAPAPSRHSVDESHLDEIFRLKARLAELEAEVVYRVEAVRNEQRELFDKQIAETEAAEGEACERASKLAVECYKLQSNQQIKVTRAETERQKELVVIAEAALLAARVRVQEVEQQLQDLHQHQAVLEERHGAEINELLTKEEKAQDSIKAILDDIVKERQQSLMHKQLAVKTEEQLVAARAHHQQAMAESNAQIDRLKSELNKATQRGEEVRKQLQDAQVEMQEALKEQQRMLAAEREERSAQILETKQQQRAMAADHQEALAQQKKADALKLKESKAEAKQALQRVTKLEEQQLLLSHQITTVRSEAEEAASVALKAHQQLSDELACLKSQHASKLARERSEHEIQLARVNSELKSVRDTAASNAAIHKTQIQAAFKGQSAIPTLAEIPAAASSSSSSSAMPVVIPKRSRAKRASVIAAAEYLEAVDLNAAAALIPLAEGNYNGRAVTRKGKRLSVVADAHQPTTNFKTAPASSLAHALNEGRSIDILASPAIRKIRPDSPTSRSRTRIGQHKQTTIVGFDTPGVAEAIIHAKGKIKASKQNKENEEAEERIGEFGARFDSAIMTAALNADESLTMRDNKSKKSTKAREKQLLSSALNKATNQTSATQIADPEWAEIAGLPASVSQAKYGSRAQHVNLQYKASASFFDSESSPAMDPAPLPAEMPVGKRTRTRKAAA